MTQDVKIIAEGEINHNGQVDLAKKLVDVAKQSGSDFIKFQCFVADHFVAEGSEYHAIFKANELSLDEFRQIKSHAESAQLPMICTAVDPKGVQMIVDLGLPMIKLGSTNITNTQLLHALAETGKPIILSTGAAYLGEIEKAIDIVSKGTDDITLMHCTVQYPAQDDAINLNIISTLKSAFPGVPIGFSDHSLGVTAAIGAVALGAEYLEKHFTTDKSLPGPDHGFSASPEDLTDYVAAVRSIQSMLGSADKKPVPVEEAVRIAGRRYLAAGRDISAGTILEPDLFWPRRVDTNRHDHQTLLAPEFQEQLIGWQVTTDLADGQPLTWNVIKPAPADASTGAAA